MRWLTSQVIKGSSQVHIPNRCNSRLTQKLKEILSPLDITMVTNLHLKPKIRTSSQTKEQGVVGKFQAQKSANIPGPSKCLNGATVSKTCNFCLSSSFVYHGWWYAPHGVLWRWRGMTNEKHLIYFLGDWGIQWMAETDRWIEVDSLLQFMGPFSPFLCLQISISKR